jgi:hypothetical protein
VSKTQTFDRVLPWTSITHFTFLLAGAEARLVRTESTLGMAFNCAD